MKNTLLTFVIVGEVSMLDHVREQLKERKVPGESCKPNLVDAWESILNLTNGTFALCWTSLAWDKRSQL